MELIAGLANMRARNYSVTEVDKLKAKLIAGRIIPAIATATAVATGECREDEGCRVIDKCLGRKQASDCAVVSVLLLMVCVDASHTVSCVFNGCH